MKKWILSAVVVLSFGAFAVYQKAQSTKPSQVSTAPSTTSVGTDDGSAGTSTATPVTTAPAASTSTTAGAFKDGTYNGPAVNAFYGTVQVAAVISGGKLTNVQILQSPSDRGESAQISSRDLPKLESEAIAAQSANINGISGATQTSDAFMQSLASALVQAKS
jgi:uncharacterized protein with FMN-binding domain